MQFFMTRPQFMLMWLVALGLLLGLAGPAAAGQPGATAVESLRQQLALRQPDTTRLRLLATLCYALHVRYAKEHRNGHSAANQ